MIKKIHWTEPSEITQRELQDKTLPWLRKTFRQCTRYFIFAGVPLSILGYFVNGPAFLILELLALASLIYYIPLNIWINVLAAQKSGVHYEVNPRGIQIKNRLYFWRQVERCNVISSDVSPHVGSLNVKIRHHKEWRILSYYKHAVDEQELLSLLERYRRS